MSLYLKERASQVLTESDEIREINNRLRTGFADLLKTNGIRDRFPGIISGGNFIVWRRRALQLGDQRSIPVNVYQRGKKYSPERSVYVDIDFHLDNGEKVMLKIPPKDPPGWIAPNNSLWTKAIFPGNVPTSVHLELFEQILAAINRNKLWVSHQTS